jgi:hypothetical protein
MTDLADTGAHRPSFLDSLGPRGLRRAEPRASIALAGAGCALAVVGVLVLAGDAGDGTGGSFNRVPGVVLTAVLVAIGALLMHQVREGALATAGSVATGFGIPALVGFAVLSGSEGSFQSTMALSTVLWLLAYVVGPGRGRPLFLGLGLFGAWSFVMQLVGSWATSATVLPLSGAYDGYSDGGAFSPYSGRSFSSSGSAFSGPDFATVGVVSLAIGVAYLLISRRLDRTGRRGMSTPFAVIALPALAQGLGAMVFELHLTAGGLLVAVVGVGLAVHGATANRRFTTWLGGLVAVGGVAMSLGNLIDDPAVVGLVFLAAGVAVVAAAQALAHRLGEPDEMQPVHERPRRRPLVAEPGAAE